MAYQPKSYRKFVAGAVTAAVVASAVAPVASAAGFSDVPANHQFAEAINSLAEQGIFVGQDGKFNINGELTRRQAAVVFSRLIEGEGKMEQVFSDVPLTDAELTKAAYEVKEAGVMTGSNGKLMPYSKLTRQQMAKIIVEHFDLKHVEGAKVEIKDLDKADASLREYIQILAENGITQVADGNFRPTQTVSRGQFAAFVYRAQQHGNPQELAITGAEVLSADGRYLEVQFNAPVGSVEKSQFEIREKGSSKRVGIESAKASGKNVELVAYDAEEDDEIKEGKEYTVTYKANGKTLSFDFERPNYLDDREDDARVTEVDADNKDFTVSYYDDVKKATTTKTIEVPEGVDFDYEAAIGMEIRVWYTGDDKLMKYEIANADRVSYDAFEVTEAAVVDKGVGEIELQTADKKYDLATDNNGDLDFKFFLNGTEIKGSDKEDKLKLDKAFDYAKVILNDKGDVAYIYAYDLDEVIVVDKVENEVIKGLGDEELNLKDFVIVKDGKTIKAADLKAGDAVYYNETADNSLGEEGYAVVYSNKVAGKVETIYDDSFKVAGKKFDYATIEYVDGDEVKTLTKADAEDFEGQEVTLYVDFNGDARFLTGTQGEGNTNNVDAILTAAGQLYTEKSNDLAVELEYVTAKGEEDTEDVFFEDLDTITVNDVEYDIEQDKDEKKDFRVEGTGDTFKIYDNTDNSLEATVQLGDNTPVKLSVDEDGEITDLEFINGTQVKDLKEEIESGDKYAEVDGGSEKKLNSDTLVFVAEKEAATDAEDIEVYKFSDIDFDISAAGTKVYFDEDGEVQYIVTKDTNGSDTTEYAAVITGGVETDGGEVVELKAFVNGVKKTYQVDKVKASLSNLEKGDIVRIELNDESGVVEDIFEPSDFVADYLLANQKDAKNLKSNKFTLGTTEYELTSGAKVYDASNPNDITIESVSDLQGKKFHVVLDAKNSTKVAAVVIIGESTVADETDYDITAPGAATITAGTVNNTNKSAVTISGTAEAGATVALSIDDTDNATAAVTKSVTVGTDGNYTTTVDVTSLKDGEVTITATVKDVNGNSSSAATKKVTKDVAAPTKPTVDAVDSDDTTVTGTTEAGATVEVYAGATKLGTATAGVDGKYSVTIAAQAAGTKLVVKAKDAAGNEVSSDEATVVAVVPAP